jgi:hypothetical protein
LVGKLAKYEQKRDAAKKPEISENDIAIETSN